MSGNPIPRSLKGTAKPRFGTKVDAHRVVEEHERQRELSDGLDRMALDIDPDPAEPVGPDGQPDQDHDDGHAEPPAVEPASEGIRQNR